MSADRKPLTKEGTMARSPSIRYGALAQTFHWLTAILVLVAFILGPEGSEQDIYRNADVGRQFHETLGLIVFVLTAARLSWRLVDRRPDPPQIARWMGIASKAVQGALYLLLLAVPLTAILGAWLEGHPLTLLAGIEVAPMIASSHSLGETVSDVHGLLGDTLLWIAGLHAAAALFHHYFLKDAVLVTMLPRWLKK